MQKRKGISLIETLISLTIVGISIIALLPVMTLRKDAGDLSKGNRFWATDGNTSTTPFNVSIGSPVIPQVGGNAVNFKVYNEGIRNKNLPVLSLTSGKFRWGGMNADISSGALDIYSGLSGGIYHRRIYSDANKLLIENFDAPVPAVTGQNGTTISLGATEQDALSGADSFVSLAFKNSRYLYVNATNNDGGANRTFNVGGSRIIGIGKNAALNYLGSNFIGIFHSDTPSNTASNITSDDGLDVGGLAIGYIGNDDGGPVYGTPSDFSLYHANNSNDYLVNVPLWAHTYVAGQILVSSDKRLKNVMGNYTKGLNELLKIKPIEYNLKSDKNKKTYVGVIAQDLEKIFPEAVVVNKATGYLMVSQDPVFYAMLNSIKDLNSRNEQLKKSNDELENKVAKLRAIRDSLKTSQGGINE